MEVSCSRCGAAKRQTKFGRTRFGSQRYKCGACGRIYTPAPKAQGHAGEVRQQAVRLSLEGLSQRKVARLLGVSQQSIGNWLNLAQARLQQDQVPQVPPAALEACDEVVELDELHTFIGTRRGQKNGHSTS